MKEQREGYSTVKNGFYRLSIRTRLVVYFCLLILLPVVTMTQILLSSMEASLHRSFERQMDYSRQNVQRALEREIEGAWRYLERMARDPVLLELLTFAESGEDVSDRLEGLARSYDYTIEKELTLETGVIPVGSSDELLLFFEGVTASYAIYPYQRANLSTDKRDEFLTVLYRVADSRGRLIGLLSAKLNYYYLSELLLEHRPTPGTILWIMESTGRLILRSDPGSVGFISSVWQNIREPMPLYDGRYRGSDVCYYWYPFTEEGWTFVYIVPQSEIPFISDLNGPILQILIVPLCVLFALLLFLARNDIQRPIDELRISMSDVEKGILNTLVVHNRRDEFSGLMEQYNRMIDHIRQMIDQLLSTEKRRLKAEILARESEIKMLQAQIMPHFLYNTLDSINWLALRHDVPEISRLIVALANFFRYSLNKGQDAIPLREELKQTESYLFIQQTRMGKDRLSYAIEAEDELLDCYLLKLILQPFVENAVIHGFASLAAANHVRIGCRRAASGQFMEISITDNGVGVDLDRMERILHGQDAESLQHYGVRNVDQRLQQVYGQESRVRYHQNAGGGTTVLLNIPIRYRMEEFT